MSPPNQSVRPIGNNFKSSGMTNFSVLMNHAVHGKAQHVGGHYGKPALSG